MRCSSPDPHPLNEVPSLHSDDEGDRYEPVDLPFHISSPDPHPLDSVPSSHLDDEGGWYKPSFIDVRTCSVSDIKSYDVFLSFRGPDTRHTIISHLYHALCQKGVHTFKDSPELEAGQKGSQLFEALETSRIAIVIFSKNYARSKWCLEELRIILELQDYNKLTVIPIFYKVSPEEVGLNEKNNGEEGCYQIAMEEMETKYDYEMVESWQEALWRAGGLIGFVLPEGEDEGNCVEEVMEVFPKDSAKVKEWREALSEAGSLSGFCFQNYGGEAELIKSVVWLIDYLLSLVPLEGPVRPCGTSSSYNPHILVPSLHLDDEDARYKPSFIDVSYDVFLSFRGPDTRNTIISHLFRALCQKGTHTFKDSPELEAGEKRSQLFEALEKSRIAIVMFSKNYARSKWCLEELRIIIKLKEQNKLTVIPIFYRVSPEEVRFHGKNNVEKGCYQIAMEEMEAKYGNEMVESWKEAVYKAGDLIGFVLPEGEDEGSCVEEVMEKVMKLLNRVPLEVAQCPIGINARLQKLKPLLKLDPHLSTVCMLGIYGPGGVGKTTLSKAICNDIMNKFDDWCFLSEVRVTPLIELQKKLLRKLLCEKDLEIQSVDEGKTMIRHRLENKRVLVILDDVDKCDQLNALAGSIDWFGKGSRIIITTRDSHVLISSGVQCRHEVKLLSEAEAAHLFQYHASGGRPDSVHMDPSLVNRFLEYAKGLPLALVVLGRLLLGRSASDWESLVEKIDQDPPQDIISTLKISFDGLDKHGQEMFLDIACFFNGWDSDYVLKVLASYGFEPTIVINILVERCLVTIESGKFQMHDLVEAMGKSIASGKCSKDDEIQNRIWSYDGLYDILPKNMGQERRATKGILLNSVMEDQEPISSSAFEDFKRLRLLIFRNALAVKGSLYFHSDLRWFEWPKYSAPAIDFRSSRKLVGIDMRWSEIRQILGKDFKELKYLNLYNCKSLEALPNLSKSLHLMDLNLTRCEKLSRLDDSIGSLDKLVHLNLQDCCNITNVPSLLRSKDFQTINFSGCSKLDKFPAIKDKLLFLMELNLEKTALKELPTSIGNLVALKNLNLSLCKELSIIPSSIFELRALEQLSASGCPKLEMFPRKIRRDSKDEPGFPNLVLLNMQYCNLQEVDFLQDLACLETLKEVYLSGNAFAQVPECISEFKNLENLWLCYCKNLLELPEVPSTIDIHVMGCRKLRCAPSINAFVCGSSRSFPADLSNCHNLHLNEIETSLSLEEIRERGCSAEVIVARKDFPLWMDFQITDCYKSYKLPIPEGISEDDILGLAASVTFRVMTERESERDFFPEVSLVVSHYEKIPRSVIDQFDGDHTWFVYIPRRPQSEGDSDYNARINWREITLGFEAQWARLEICGVRIVCKNELDDQRFKLQKIEARMDYQTESETESDNESS